MSKSNLDYSIAILVAEGKEIATSLQLHGDDITKKKELLDGINSAIHILRVGKYKEEMRGKKERELLLEKYKNIKL